VKRKMRKTTFQILKNAPKAPTHDSNKSKIDMDWPKVPKHNTSQPELITIVDPPRWKPRIPPVTPQPSPEIVDLIEDEPPTYITIEDDIPSPPPKKHTSKKHTSKKHTPKKKRPMYNLRPPYDLPPGVEVQESPGDGNCMFTSLAMSFQMMNMSGQQMSGQQLREKICRKIPKYIDKSAEGKTWEAREEAWELFKQAMGADDDNNNLVDGILASKQRIIDEHVRNGHKRSVAEAIIISTEIMNNRRIWGNDALLSVFWKTLKPKHNIIMFERNRMSSTGRLCNFICLNNNNPNNPIKKSWVILIRNGEHYDWGKLYDVQIISNDLLEDFIRDTYSNSNVGNDKAMTNSCFTTPN